MCTSYNPPLISSRVDSISVASGVERVQVFRFAGLLGKAPGQTGGAFLFRGPTKGVAVKPRKGTLRRA